MHLAGSMRYGARAPVGQAVMQRSQPAHGSAGTGGRGGRPSGAGSGTGPSGRSSRLATTPRTIHEPAPGA